jgi:transglutaminase-like putative cysteine protease
MPTFRITHVTTCRHSGSAGAAWQMLQLRPRDEPLQACLDFQLEISPAATDLDTRTDYFGNTRHYFTIRQPHEVFTITSHSVVRRDDPALTLPGLSPPLATARRRDAALALQGRWFQLEQYRHATTYAPLLQGAARLADGLDPDKLNALEWIAALGARFAETFTFDPQATDLSTPLATVLANKRGVCQDFTHVFLSCVRQHGLPAAYVSGYLLTHPPPGQPRLRGADAMHAWASVFVPDIGWVDFDPTNNCFAGTSHLVVARGRDYADVSPTRGVFTAGGTPMLKVAVTVEPEED